MDCKRESEIRIERYWSTTDSYFRAMANDISIGRSSSERPNNIRQFYILQDNKQKKVDYAEYLKKNTSSSHYTSLIQPDRRLFTIASIMNYIPMSIDNINDHKLTYIIDESNSGATISYWDIQKDEQPLYINKNRGYLECIMDYWINRAIQLAGRQPKCTYRLPNDQTEHTRFFLRGKPGVGKTALLNYLFSVFANRLINRENIIWVRVDLNKHGSDVPNLKGLLCKKFLKIFCTQYLGNAKLGFDDLFLQNLEELLLRKKRRSDPSKPMHDPEMVKCYIEMLEEIKEILWKSPDVGETKEQRKRRKGIDLTPIFYEFGLSDMHVNKLTDSLMSFIQDRNRCGYIFMFDGFDSVTLDYVQLNSFKKWASALEYTTNNSRHNYKALYVITIRDYSLLYLYEKNRKQKYQPKFIELRIQSQMMTEILRKKFELAEKRLKEVEYHVTKLQIENIVLNLMKAVYSALGIKPDPQICGTPGTLSYYLEHFRILNADNFRKAMRFFRVLLPGASYILGKKSLNELFVPNLAKNTKNLIKRKEWMIQGLLLFGDWKPKVYRNRIQFENPAPSINDEYKDSSLISIDDASKAVIPNVFNFREFITDATSSKMPKNLFKLRVIQGLKERGSRWGITDIIDWCCRNFGYDKEGLRFETREMIYNGLLEVEAPRLGSEVQLGCIEEKRLNYTIILTELGYTILQNLIQRSIYYEIVCDDTPIQMDFVDLIKPLSRFQSNLSLGEYLVDKTKAIINFYLYLRMVEDKEREHFEKGKDKNNIFNKKWRIFTPKLEKSLKESMVKYLSSYLTKKPSQVSKILAKWDTEFKSYS